MSKPNRTELMAKGPVARTMLYMSISTTIGMLVIAIYNFVDAFFIGKLNDINALSAISIALPLNMITSTIGLTIGVGSGTFLSRTLGANRFKRGKIIVANAVSLSIVLSIIYTIVVYINLENILQFMNVEGEVLDACLVYCRWMVVSSLFVILNQSMNNLIRGEGKTEYSMVALILGAGINMILDPIFIFGLDMGLSGAAIATVIGQFASTVYLFAFYIRKKSIVGLDLRNTRFEVPYMRQVLLIGIPVFMQQMLQSLAAILLNYAGTLFGPDALSAIGTTNRIYMFSLYFLVGYAQAFQPFAAYNFGAKNYLRVMKAVKFSVIYAFCLGLVFTVIFTVFSYEFVGVLVQLEDVRTLATNNLIAMSITLPFVALIYILVRFFQALGKAREALIASVLRQGIFYIPLILYLPRIFIRSGAPEFIKHTLPFPMVDGLYGVMLAQPIADILSFVLIFALSISTYMYVSKLNGKYSNA